MENLMLKRVSDESDREPDPESQPLERYEKDLAHGLSSELVEVAINRVYRRLIPRWHFAMLNDVERNEAFSAALKAVVTPDDVVLDVGTGTGLLAMLAARAGARVVVSCEAIRPIAQVAKRIVAANNLSSHISIVAKTSSELRVGRELPDRADVLVTETVDCGLLGENILPIIRHAREHLLREGATVIPRGARVFFCLLESKGLHRNNYAREAGGLDVSLFNRFSSREHFPVRLSTWEHRLLSAPQPFFDFNFEAGELAPREAEVSVEVEADGLVHGIVFWFDLELSEGIHLTNAPANVNSHWMQAFHCFETPVRVERGAIVAVNVAHDETSFRFTMQPKSEGALS